MNQRELISEWANLLRSPESDLVRLVLTAPYQYKHYQIPKRTGGRRDIFHPTPDLKAIQRWLVSASFSKLPVHQSVYSYRTGLGVRNHAEAHVHSNFLLRLDFADFFPSIDETWLKEFLSAEAETGRLGFSIEAVPLLARVACRYSKRDKTLALSIGAPSSPAISNAILFCLDEQISRMCAELDCVYTRYADDLYISARLAGRLQLAERELRKSVAELAPRLRINEAKTTNVSKKTTRIVTGLVLTSDRKVSIGRELKRSVKTRIYLWTVGGLPVEEADRLGGLLAYVRDVEPTFFHALVVKFGQPVLARLLRRDF